MDTKEIKGRKFQITCNNPKDKGYTFEVIKNMLKSYDYACYSEEIGLQTGTHHFHIFLYKKSTIRLSTLIHRWPGAHIELCYGTSEENRDYVFKEGKYIGSEKEETNIKDTHYETGNIPDDGGTNQNSELIDLIKSGYTNAEIFNYNSNLIFKAKQIDKIREDILSEKYRRVKRDVYVDYIYILANGEELISQLQEKYDYTNLFIIDSYVDKRCGVYFDGYTTEKAICFNNFQGDVSLENMKRMMSGRPQMLDARFSDKRAMYTKLYIVSYLTLDQLQNRYARKDAVWKEFVKSINAFHQFDGSKLVKINI